MINIQTYIVKSQSKIVIKKNLYSKLMIHANEFSIYSVFFSILFIALYLYKNNIGIYNSHNYKIFLVYLYDNYRK